LSGRSTTAPIGPIEGYLVDTTTWEVQEIKSNDEDEVPSHRWGHSAVVVDNRYIFLFGGRFLFSSSLVLLKFSLYEI
jgi:hypothetical protein